jgi:hypothetical protein
MSMIHLLILAVHLLATIANLAPGRSTRRRGQILVDKAPISEIGEDKRVRTALLLATTLAAGTAAPP